MQLPGGSGNKDSLTGFKLLGVLDVIDTGQPALFNLVSTSNPVKRLPWLNSVIDTSRSAGKKHCAAKYQDQTI